MRGLKRGHGCRLVCCRRQRRGNNQLFLSLCVDYTLLGHQSDGLLHFARCDSRSGSCNPSSRHRQNFLMFNSRAQTRSNRAHCAGLEYRPHSWVMRARRLLVRGCVAHHNLRVCSVWCWVRVRRVRGWLKGIRRRRCMHRLAVCYRGGCRHVPPTILAGLWRRCGYRGRPTYVRTCTSASCSANCSACNRHGCSHSPGNHDRDGVVHLGIGKGAAAVRARCLHSDLQLWR